MIQGIKACYATAVTLEADNPRIANSQLLQAVTPTSWLQTVSKTEGPARGDFNMEKIIGDLEN